MVATTPVVLVGAVDASALIAELARDVRVHILAFVTVLALREKLAFVLVLKVRKLAL